MLTAIYNYSLKREQLENIGEKDWSKIIGSAVEFATHVCLSYENYISKEFAKELKIRSV
jgi:fructokinase